MRWLYGVNGESYVLWRAVDSEGYELGILLQKRRNKKSATRFLKRLLGTHPTPRVIVTDKLRSYCLPIKTLARTAEHRHHKGLNNRAENSHQPIRRREKSLIKMKKVSTAQKLLKLMGLTHNLFAVNAGRYAKPDFLPIHLNISTNIHNINGVILPGFSISNSTNEFISNSF